MANKGKRKPAPHTETKWYGEKSPKCNFCGAPAKYDGKTQMGPWALMCPQHFRMYGIGLGLGRGQKLIKNPNMTNPVNKVKLVKPSGKTYYFTRFNEAMRKWKHGDAVWIWRDNKWNFWSSAGLIPEGSLPFRFERGRGQNPNGRNRIAEAIVRADEKLRHVSPAEKAKLSKSLKTSFSDLVQYQNLQAAAFASGRITVDEAQILYRIYGGEAPLPERWDKRSLAERIIGTKIAGELLGVKNPRAGKKKESMLKGLWFYQEFSDKSKKKPTGNVVCLLGGPWSYGEGGAGFWGASGYLYEALGAVLWSPNSPVGSTSVSPDYLRQYCKRISRKEAEKIHPELFKRLREEGNPFDLVTLGTAAITGLGFGAGLFTVKTIVERRAKGKKNPGPTLQALQAGVRIKKRYPGMDVRVRNPKTKGDIWR